MEKWLDNQRARRSAPRRLCHRPPAAADRTVGRSARRARAARRAAEGQGEIPRQGGVRPRLQRQDRRDRGDGLAAGFRSEQSEGSARSRSHQPPDHRRLRDGLDLQGVHAGDGARLRQDRSRTRRGMRAAPLHYGKFTIHDDQPKGRFINMKEVFTYSSNIGAARIALGAGRRGAQGVPAQDGPARRGCAPSCRRARRRSCRKRWGELNTITIAFGHGMRWRRCRR